MPDRNHLQIEQLRDGGYLHEVNRLVLHPLGLALEANTETGELRVWDERSDPEGIYFGEDLLNADKARKVCDELIARRDARIDKLGYVVQPIPGERVLVTNYVGRGDPPPRVNPDLEFEQ